MKKILRNIIFSIMLFATLQNCLAATTISNSVTLTQSVLDSYSWPVTINGGSSVSPVILTLGENVTLTSALNYFIINGSYITFEGNNKSITITDITNYSGLIQNGTSTTNGFNNLTIQNLGVLAVNSTIGQGQAWIGQTYFAKNASNNLVRMCYTNGPISLFGGGILGEYSTGTATNCYSTGSIGECGGGIFGGLNSYSTATNCYSTGSIGKFAGGIFSHYASNSTATNCFSTGSIGQYAGGISGNRSSNISITNCYSTGSIGNIAGGILGRAPSNSTITNCYSTGTIESGSGGIFGPFYSNIISTNCYEANGTWVSNDANTALTGEDGSVWNTNTSPYTLIALATIVSTNTSIDQAWIDKHVYNLPILLDENVTLTISEDLIFTNANCYFAVRGTGVTFDGNFKKITIKDITNYRGLVNNGNYLGNNVGAISGSIVKNIGVLSNNSSLKEYCGWIGQQGYGNGEGFSITYCYSNGNMTNNGSGGILGQAYMNGTISNCYSLGNISGSSSAGIVVARNQDASKISNCYSNGSITGSNANGICEANRRGGGASFTNCYAADGNFNTTTANSKLTGTDGTVWNTSVTPYTLSAFNTITLKWGLSANGLKTQDNTIQLDINGKKGTSSPVNENGKVN